MALIKHKITSFKQKGLQFIRKISLIKRGKVLTELAKNNNNTKGSFSKPIKKRTILME
jgi:hypothetical protein